MDGVGVADGDVAEERGVGDEDGALARGTGSEEWQVIGGPGGRAEDDVGRILFGGGAGGEGAGVPGDESP